MDRIPEALLDRSVAGLNLGGLDLSGLNPGGLNRGGTTLREQFTEGPNLWVFLRHFG